MFRYVSRGLVIFDQRKTWTLADPWPLSGSKGVRQTKVNAFTAVGNGEVNPREGFSWLSAPKMGVQSANLSPRPRSVVVGKIDGTAMHSLLDMKI